VGVSSFLTAHQHIKGHSVPCVNSMRHTSDRHCQLITDKSTNHGCQMDIDERRGLKSIL